MNVVLLSAIFLVFYLCFASADLATATRNDTTDDDIDHDGLVTVKIPLPKVTHKLDKKYCINTNESATVRGECTATAPPVGSSKSPCPFHCFAAHDIQAGDPCDPLLYRFARRQYDDEPERDKDWMGATPGTKGIIGRSFSDVDADFQYKGYCRFLCPRALCMSVDRDPKDKEQFVDLVKWDCVSNNLLDKYEGVCTCGYLWSVVDPAFPNRTLDRSTLLVDYKMTVGLNRRLAWDAEYKRCAAQRYGHCSLVSNWTDVEDEELKTFCLHPDEFKCVNRSANFLGVAYRPLLTTVSNRWYGICDSQVLIEDPFSKGSRMEITREWTAIILSLIILPNVHQYTNLN